MDETVWIATIKWVAIRKSEQDQRDVQTISDMLDMKVMYASSVRAYARQRIICPTCKAPAGSWCKTKNGKAMFAPHVPRCDVARASLAFEGILPAAKQKVRTIRIRRG